MNFLQTHSINFLVVLLVVVMTGINPARGRAQSSETSFNHPDRPPTVAELMQWKETFTFEVYYSFFTLGQVKVTTVTDTTYQGEPRWYLHSVITSNSSIPLVGEEENHYSTIYDTTGGQFNALDFWTDNMDEGERKTSEYIFDRAADRVYAMEQGLPPDTLALEDPASAGHITFLAGRLLAGADSLTQVPIYLNREKKYMLLSSLPAIEKRSYDAFDDDIKTVKVEGQTNVDGPFGFSGEFESWYRADDLRIPVEARVKVWLGKAKVKLIDYKKELRND